jgi:hypothetical protein
VALKRAVWGIFAINACQDTSNRKDTIQKFGSRGWTWSRGLQIYDAR